MADPVRVGFGTAHLFLRPDDEARSAAVLAVVLALPVGLIDTAPSYGHGRSEERVGVALAGLAGRPLVTTKVGLEPVLDPSPLLRAAKAASRRLPAPVQQRLRGGGGERRGLDPGLVRASVSRSLQRLGRIDRLLLHEVHPADLTDEVLGILAGSLAAGDVAAVGVATQDLLTAPCVARAPDLLTVAHVTASLLRPPVVLPVGVTVRVGHGLLGPAAVDLSALRAVLGSSRELADRWAAAVAGTSWEGPDGLAHAVLGAAAGRGLTDVVVATSRANAVAGTVAAAAAPPPPEIARALAVLAAQCSTTD